MEPGLQIKWKQPGDCESGCHTSNRFVEFTTLTESKTLDSKRLGKKGHLGKGTFYNLIFRPIR